MADNVGYTPGAGATIAADDIGGVLYQRIKPVTGADGSAVDVSTDNPLPMQEVGGAMSLLSRILNVLMSPMGFDRSLSRQRVTGIIESGTVTTVTTVTTCTTVTGLTNIDGRSGSMLINQTNISAWADCVRARIS
jgi:hypothetical protein